MRVSLIPHPMTPCPAVVSLEAEIKRTWKEGVAIVYRLCGELGDLRFAPPAKPAFVDGLADTTCFAALVRDRGGAGYCEYNYSPSGQYAIYEYGAYRDGMTRGYCSQAPILTEVRDDCFELRSGVGLLRAHQTRGHGALEVALGAVIETTSGAKSYWALKHPAEKPDFHDPQSFVVELP